MAKNIKIKTLDVDKIKECFPVVFDIDCGQSVLSNTDTGIPQVRLDYKVCFRYFDIPDFSVTFAFDFEKGRLTDQKAIFNSMMGLDKSVRRRVICLAVDLTGCSYVDNELFSSDETVMLATVIIVRLWQVGYGFENFRN